MLLKETLNHLPNPRVWYTTWGNSPSRVEKRDWRALPPVRCDEKRASIEEVVEYYEFRAVRTFNNDFDWELL